MSNTTIGVVINFCSNEQAFLPAVLEQCAKFTNHIAVSYGDKMFDGTSEAHVEPFLEYYKFKYPFVKFIKYEVDLVDATPRRGVVNRPTAYWCNLARWLGIQALKGDGVDWYLFLDADEIPEGEVFREWLHDATLDPVYAYKFLNYWYFKDVVFQAKTWEDSILFAHIGHLTEDTVFHDDERDGILKVSGAKQHRNIPGRNNLPMFHHFSWVRSKHGLEKKMRTWAHRDDIFKNVDVKAIIEYIYRNDNVNDVVHNYEYQVVDNKYNIVL